MQSSRLAELNVAPGVRAYASVRAMLAPLGLFLVIGLAYVYTVSGGTWDLNEQNVLYYDLLADAFEHGQLHLLIEPNPALLALVDPYDPQQNFDIDRLHDASLYQGKYYLYWGPFPGVVHAAWHKLTGVPVSQNALHVLLLLMACAGFWAVLRLLQQEYLAGAPRFLLPVLMLQFAFNAALLPLLAFPLHYQEAIVFDVGLIVPSWLCFFLGLSRPRHAGRYLALSGLCAGLAIASRVTMLPYALSGFVILAWLAFSERKRALWEGARRLAAYCVPLGIVGALLLLYNALRFGSPLEFGMNYVLQGDASYYINVVKATHEHPLLWKLVSMVKVFLLYIGYVPSLAPYAPYLALDPMSMIGYGNLLMRTYLLFDFPMASIFLIAPVGLFALLYPFRRTLLPGERSRPVELLLVHLLLGTALAMLILCDTQGVTLRYTADLVPALMLAGSIILLETLTRRNGVQPGRIGRAARRWWTRAAPSVIALSTLGAVLFGVLCGLAAWARLYPGAAYPAYARMDGMVAGLRVAAAPGSIPEIYRPCGPGTWRAPDGRYLRDAPIYLRVPEGGAALIAWVDSDLPPRTEISIKVGDQPPVTERLRAGQQVVMTPKLTGLQPGQIVPVQLGIPAPPAPEAAYAHLPVPLTIAGIGLTNQDERDASRLLRNLPGGCIS